MAITATTLSGAVTASQNTVPLTAVTGVSAPVDSTGSGLTYLYIGNELMKVVGLTGLQVSVLRGQGGSPALAHGASEPVLIGGPSDFPKFVPAQAAEVPLKPSRYDGVSAPVASATSITPSGAIFHVTGTTATTTITLPTNFVEGKITVIADGIWTWSTGGNIAVAGTVTTAGSSVDFTYDAATSTWYPSRLA